jgi:hypothetical protein
MTTLTMLHAHDVSKLKVTVASWSADRIGPTIIAAPHPGHAHVARVVVSVVVDSVADGSRCRQCGGGEYGSREGQPSGPARVRKESRLADAHEAARQDVLDEATQKRLNDLDVAANGRRGIVATHELVAQALESNTG